MLQGLIFDMADVLYDATAWRRWLLQLLPRLGVSADYHTFYRAWDRDYLVEVQCGRREFHEAFQAFLFAQGLSWAQIDEVEAAAHIRRVELEREVRPLPCVAATLGQLCAAGLKLVVLTNAAVPAAELQKILERLGLADRFSAVWSSFDLEAAKPAAVCYQAALDSLRLPARQAAYVGHQSLALAGAQRVGLRTIAFNHEPAARADIYLQRFSDLPAALKAWKAAGLGPAAASAAGRSRQPAIR